MLHEDPPTIRTRDVSFAVGAQRLLDSIAIEGHPGELIGLIGPNGAGKTTLLRVIAGLIPPAEGSVQLTGEEVSGLSAGQLARKVGYVQQIAPDSHGFTGAELVMMGRYAHLGRWQLEREEDLEIVRNAMKTTETERFAQRTVSTLSGGERQRVFVARAFAQQANLLLLDEPTANLDLQNQLRVLDIVRDEVARGVTAIAAVHDLTLAARYCDRLILLANGRMVAEGTPAEVLTPRNIESVFAVESVVYPDPLTGSPTLSVLGPARGRLQPFNRTRVHVICGGGSGARFMYALQRAGYMVTAGVLGAGDTDRMAADIMGVSYVPIPAFGEIGDEAHERHMYLIARGDITVLCEMPIGQNNLRNLDAAAIASTLITIETGPPEARDLTAGLAVERLNALRPVARCRDVGQGLAAIEAAATTGNRGETAYG